MKLVVELFIRTIVGFVWFVALVLATILLAPIHILIMLSGSIVEKPSVNSQWVW